jgi:hypothetical protein
VIDSHNSLRRTLERYFYPNGCSPGIRITT